MTSAESQQQPASSGRGKAFFDRGDQVAETGNWDFAIQMYLEGIRREPGNLERGHKPLREVALKRKAQGGKPAGLMEQMKRKGGKEPIDVLINAEYVLAKDPGNVGAMVNVLKAAQQLEEPAVVKWICDILFEAMRQTKRPNKRTLTMIAQAYAGIEEYASAVHACDMALKLDPNNGDLQEMARDYSARQTIKQGGYDGEGSFVKSVRDMEHQKQLAERDRFAQSRDFIEAEIEKARAEYEQNPTVPGKIDALADALLKLEEEAYENEAIDVLKKAHADTGAYRFKMRMDDVKIRQMRRRFSKLRAAGEKERAMQMAREQLAFELEVFAERAANYPTDLSLKFELGRRQLMAGKIDEAIASLQQAQRDPKRRIHAMSLLGQAFARKGWYREAVDTYKRALELEPSEDRAKELHYNVADCLQTMGENQQALDHYSRVAQLDYNYKDVRERIEKLRQTAK